MTTFSLAPQVERRPISARNAVTFDLEYPPRATDDEACKGWESRSSWKVAANRPGRVPGPVKMTVVLEEKSHRRIMEDLTQPIINLCVKHLIIDSDSRNTLREVNMRFGHVHGVRVTIESAVTIERRSA